MALPVPLKRHLTVSVMSERTGLPMIRALATVLQDEAMEVRPLRTVEGTPAPSGFSWRAMRCRRAQTTVLV